MKEYNAKEVGFKNGKASTTYHDAALKRCDSAEYHPEKDSNIDIEGAEWTIFVGRLPTTTSKEGIEKYFQKYGKIAKINYVKDLCSGEFKGYCFIEYEHRADAKYAYESAHGKKLSQTDPVPMLVDKVRGGVQKGWKPRRFGGGYGGNIKSSQLRFGGRERPYVPIKKQITHQQRPIPKSHGGRFQKHIY